MTEMTEPRWKRRFRAPSLTLPHWAVGDPERLVYASNRSGSWQVHAWDRRDGSQRQVTDHPTGVVMGAPTPDGQGVLWFDDSKGDEIGVWRLQPFHKSEVTPLAPDVEPAWSAGLALAANNRLALGTADRTSFSVRVGRIGAPTTELYQHEQTVDLADVSRDCHPLMVHHAEHGDNLHPALRAFDLDRGEAIGDLWDGKGYGLMASRFSPVPGDWRLALLHECGGLLRPALWNPVAGERTDLEMDLPGQVEVADWWPDGGALLLVHTPAGREVRAVGRSEPVLRPPGEPAPGGEPYQSWTFTNQHGDQVHGFLALPSGQGPHPTVMLVHGGPTHHDADAWSPQVQALVDHGWAVALVNYRGSTGYGKAWQDALEGDPGRPEVEDVTAGRDDLVKRRVADPDRVMIAGASWGGYITLQTIGTVPEGWRVAVAVVPVADYLSAYADESEVLQAFDRSLFGGSPEEKPDLYRERSPITHVEQVRTPVLIMVGDNDTRCPLQQVLNYAKRLEEYGKRFELDRFDAGHGALVTEERIRQTGLLLDFGARHVPGVHPAER